MCDTENIYIQNLVTGNNSGGGVDEFTELIDTPNAYTGEARRMLQVNDSENALEYSHIYSGTPAGANDLIIGQAATSSMDGNVVIGNNSTSTGNDAIIIGDSSSLEHNGVILIGRGLSNNSAETTATNEIRIGNPATINPISSFREAIIIGSNTQASVGNGGLVTGEGSINIGHNNDFTSRNLGLIIGNNSNVGFGVVVGHNSSAGSSSISIGTNSSALSSTVTIGINATATGNSAVVIGSNLVFPTTGASESVAIGNDVNAFSQTVTIGEGSRTTGSDSVAIGHDSSAAANAIAIGDSVTSSSNEERFGEGYLYNNSSNNYRLTNLTGTGTEAVMASSSGTLSRLALDEGLHATNIANITNVAANTVNSMYWQQIGNTVSSYFAVTISLPVVGNISSFELDLPVARTANFTDGSQLRGTFNIASIDNDTDRVNQGADDVYRSMNIVSVGGTQRVRVAFSFVSIVNSRWLVSGSFSYRL